MNRLTDKVVDLAFRAAGAIFDALDRVDAARRNRKRPQ